MSKSIQSKISLLEALTGKEVFLKEAKESVSVYAVMPGNIISTSHGDLIVIDIKPGKTRRNLEVIKAREKDEILSGQKEPKIATLSVPGQAYIDIIGKVKPIEFEKLKNKFTKKKQDIQSHNNQVTQKKFEANSEKINWSSELHQWVVTALNGDTVKAGDRVVVRFSNGDFKGDVKAVAGRQDGAITVVFPGRTKGRAVSAKMIVSKA